MGQKVNPVGFRILNKKTWESVWFDKKSYATKLVNDVQIRKFIKTKYAHCGIASVIIERPSDKLHLIIKTSKPGVLIGKKGGGIETLRAEISSRLGVPVHLNVEEVKADSQKLNEIDQKFYKRFRVYEPFKTRMGRYSFTFMYHLLINSLRQAHGLSLVHKMFSSFSPQPFAPSSTFE